MPLRFMKHIVAILALSGACASRSDAQSREDSVAVEMVAARDLLARHGRYARLDSAFALPGHAPGVPTAMVRPSLRHSVLVDSLYAHRPVAKEPHNATLILSEPEFAGDSAMVTATVSYDTGRRPRGGFYETVLLVLRRSGPAWRVHRLTQLGIT